MVVNGRQLHLEHPVGADLHVDVWSDLPGSEGFVFQRVLDAVDAHAGEEPATRLVDRMAPSGAASRGSRACAEMSDRFRRHVTVDPYRPAASRRAEAREESSK